MCTIEEILMQYYNTHDTIDLAILFEAYMSEIGAVKLDRRKNDTSNTYLIDGKNTNWNRVECYYYKKSGDWRGCGKFDLCITLRKRSGDYFLFETGGPDAKIKRPFEISNGKVIKYDKEIMEKIIKNHAKLFSMMCEQI